MLRRKSSFLFGLPATALLFGCLVSAVVAQETSEESKSDQEKSPEAKAVVAEGKVVVSGPDGKVRVFNLKKGDGQSYFFAAGDDQQEEAAGEGDKSKKKRIAIVVGPDGVKQEVKLETDIELSGQANGVWMVEPGQANGEVRSVFRVVTGEEGNSGIRIAESPEILAQLAAQVGGYMIGVSCDPVSDTLASQLGLEKGLVVSSVTDDGPASGKLEAHDIITHSDGTAIGDVNELIKAVQAAGEADGEMKLTVLRKGKSLEVVVKPVKREARSATITLPPGQAQWTETELKRINPGINAVEGVLLESIGPGVFRFESHPPAGGATHSADALKAEIEALRKQIEELSGRLEKDD